MKETLEKMIADLTKEKEDEIALKDWCYDEIRKNERTTEMTDRTKEGLVSKIDDLTSTIDTLAKGIAEQEANIAEMQVQLKRPPRTGSSRTRSSSRPWPTSRRPRRS